MNQTLAAHPIRTEPLPLEFPGAQYMDQEEIDAVVRVLKSRSLFRYYGIDPQNEVGAFEQEFAEFVGAKHALAVSSGLGALSVALSALGVGPGQEVIIPAYMWVSVAAAVVNHGAIPVVADIDDTFWLGPREAREYDHAQDRGIIMVHMSGAPADIKAIRTLLVSGVCCCWRTAPNVPAEAWTAKRLGLSAMGNLQLPDEQEHDLRRRGLRGDQRPSAVPPHFCLPRSGLRS